MNEIIDNLRTELNQNADERVRKSGERFFKEDVKLYGIPAAAIHRISKIRFESLKGMEKQEIFSLCDELWKSGIIEETLIACNWSYYVRTYYTKDDFAMFDRWVRMYVNNWASCDTLCNHSVGSLVEMYPEHLSGLKQWALSSGRWVRRAAAVSLIIPARNGKFLEEIFEIAGILLDDPDDMVQKGYGWMLKAASQASQANQEKVFGYIMEHRATMPRTSLRYAIEKLPAELKVLAMAK
jgi:3-methyladenine DNA glycosylase AlkD